MKIDAKGLQETIDWLGKFGSNVQAGLVRSLSSTEAQSKIREQARATVDEVVYKAYPQEFYVRQYNLLEGVDTEIRNENPVAIGVFIRKDYRTESEAGKDRGEVTYALYMLPEYSEHSFFKGKAIGSLPRDFLSEWEKTFSELLPEPVADGIMKELSR